MLGWSNKQLACRNPQPNLQEHCWRQSSLTASMQLSWTNAINRRWPCHRDSAVTCSKSMRYRGNLKTEAVARNRVVATIGLHGSASTWVFNVVRELMIASFGQNQISAVYTEELGELPSLSQAGQHVLVKSHSGTPDLDAWLRAVEAEIVLSIRDPRDAAISMSQRFNAPLERTAGWLARDCRRMMELGDRHPLLRYEDQFLRTARRWNGLPLRCV